MICVEQRKEFFDFANKILNGDFEPIKSRCIASCDSEGNLLGVVVFDRFTKSGCELNVASICPRFLTRQLLVTTFHYIFKKLGLMRVTIIVKEDNVKSLRMQRGIGFIEEARLKNMYGDKDGILFRMLKHECKWIR